MKVPENGWLEYFLVSFWDDLFSGAMLVSGRVSKPFWTLTGCQRKGFVSPKSFSGVSCKILGSVGSGYSGMVHGVRDVFGCL